MRYGRRARGGAVEVAAVFSIIRLMLRLIWVAIIVLGVKRLLELMQSGLDEVISRVEEGEQDGVSESIVRLHEALHRRHGHEVQGSDATGEM